MNMMTAQQAHSKAVAEKYCKVFEHFFFDVEQSANTGNFGFDFRFNNERIPDDAIYYLQELGYRLEWIEEEKLYSVRF